MLWKVIKRTLLTVIVLILALVLLFVGLIAYSAVFGLKTTDNDLANYDMYREDKICGDFMPALDSLGNYEDVAFGETEVYYSPFFISETMNLFVQYSPEDYAAVKATALEGRTLLTEPVYYADNTDNELMLLPVLEYKGYQLQAIDVYGHEYAVCKYVGFIGFNDEDCAVCYLLYNDDDRDYIGEADEDPVKAMHKWLKKEFWWHDFD